MKKRKAFEKAADSAAEYVVNTVGDIKEGARSMVDEASRVTQKKMHDVRAATEATWGEVESKANALQSQGVTQVRRHPIGSVAIIIGAVLLVSLIFFFLRPERG
jgi:acyl-CoA reductase-like NAD-dependent aldehyde dehydrogenase